MTKRNFVICILLLTGAPYAWCYGDQKDLKMIEGTWLPAMAELGGEPFKDEQLRKMKLVLKGDKYVAHVGDAADEGTIKLDSTKKLKTWTSSAGKVQTRARLSSAFMN